MSADNESHADYATVFRTLDFTVHTDLNDLQRLLKVISNGAK